MTSFDVARVRGLYPTLGAGTAHLDGSFGALQPEIGHPGDHHHAAVLAGPARLQLGAVAAAPQPRSRRPARAVADLVGGAAPDAVVLGASLSTLLARFAGGHLARTGSSATRSSSSRLDPDAGAAGRCWPRPARAASSSGGPRSTWRPASCPTGSTTSSITGAPASSPCRWPTRPPARCPTSGRSPTSPIDAVRWSSSMPGPPSAPADRHRGPRRRPDRASRRRLRRTDGGARWSPGPACCRARRRRAPCRSRSASSSARCRSSCSDGVTAAVDHLAGLDESRQGSRRERLIASIAAAGADERRSTPASTRRCGRCRASPCSARPPSGCPCWRSRWPAHPARSARLAAHGVSVWTGGGLSELMTAFGADELGAGYVGLMPHTTPAEVDQLLDGLTAGLTRAAAPCRCARWTPSAGGPPPRRRGSAPGR